MKDNFTLTRWHVENNKLGVKRKNVISAINNLHSFLHRWCIDNNGLLKVNAARELFYQKFGMNEEIGLDGMIKCKKCHLYLVEKFPSVHGMYSNVSRNI